MKNIVKISLLIALLMAPVMGNAQKIYLVAVGVSDYPGTVNDLRLPANDAKVMQWLYQRNKKAETILLQDRKATVKNVVNAMNSLYSRATEKDIVIFFFSGHGTETGSFCCYDRFLHYEDVRKAMINSKSRHKMIFADACFSGKIRQNGSFSDMSPETDFSKVDLMLFLSSRSNETSIEQRNMKNGFFTAMLQRGLKGGADKNQDRVITAKELFEYVSDGVKTLSRDRQHPVMWGRFDTNMPVMIWD